MAVPSPSVKPTRIPRGVAHYLYRGPIGSLGPALNIDLTDILESVRVQDGFREHLYVFIQPLDAVDGISVDPVSIQVLPAEPAVPEYARLDMTSLNAAGQVQILVETHHSIGR